ncbi:hypothetical protein AAF712_012912 [Marasmius tenuissimus]|uniref:Uncharacterized protein n=1 Tax=Marasmius tenuissimus TaxID=585030 RepID=A0ABR2ZGI2_9AGAR
MSRSPSNCSSHSDDDHDDIDRLQAIIEGFEAILTESNKQIQKFPEDLKTFFELCKTEFGAAENFHLFEGAMSQLCEFIVTRNPWAHAMGDLAEQTNELLSFMRQDRIHMQQYNHVRHRVAECEGLIARQEEKLANLRSVELKLGEYEASVAAFERLGFSMKLGEVSEHHQPILHSNVFARLVAIQDGLQVQQAIALDDARTEISKLNQENDELEASLQSARVRAQTARASVSACERRKIAFNAVCKFVLTVIAMLLAAYIMHLRTRGSF